MGKRKHKAPYASVAKILGRFRLKPKIVGFVEKVDEVGVSGWALDREGGAFNLALKVNGRTFPLEHNPVERADVAQRHGDQFINAGFHAAIDPDTLNSVQLACSRADVLEVLANDTPLKTLVPLRAESLVAFPPTNDQLNIDVTTPTLVGKIESWGSFTLHGWMVRNGAPVSSVRVICNGVEHECATLVLSRPEVSTMLGIGAEEIGFELELPGYLWESVAGNEPAHLELLFDGDSPELEPLVLERTKAQNWIADIFMLAKGTQSQHRMLLGLEHAHYGQLFTQLDEHAGAKLAAFANRMGLDHFVPESTKSVTESNSARPPATRQLVWRALRALNERIHEGAVFPHVKAVLAQHGLVGIARDEYLFSVVPLLCRHGEFEALRELMDFSRLHVFATSADNWQRSMALPALVSDGELGRATEVLLGLAKDLEGGWLNTECVRWTVEVVVVGEREGKFTQHEAEKLYRSAITLLDGFKGDWFSRLHDRELIDMMLILVDGMQGFTNLLRDHIVAAAVRLYGLNPAFWARLDERRLVPIGDLLRAERAWALLKEALVDTATPITARAEVMRRQLDYFARHDNPEVAVYLRDIVAHALPLLNKAPSADGRDLIERLFALAPTEALRLAAAPLGAPNHLALEFAETSERLLHTLRKHSKQHLSIVYDLQCEAAVLLNKATEAAAQGETDRFEEILDHLEEKAAGLSNWAGHFLGAELLARAYILARSNGFAGDRYLGRLGEVIRTAVKQTDPGWHLPPAVQAAVAWLAGGTQDPLLASFITDTKKLVEGKLGIRHHTLFMPPIEGPGTLRSTGVYGDTLVVIYSCRKYLDTRVQAIRETWIEDLRRRDIPYVILVGGGSDTLDGDVLALDVSDLYEDLPKKSLRLFEWVYRNTRAQYVLKIDDDCYLDVARYFDTLSYRKHDYYGRILRRGEGDMDRVWHQAKSHTNHGRKSFDKSPEPSKYADGGGGYSLSRQAIAKLLEARETTAGRRLVANSFMEDKLIGDLLGLMYIHPSDEDYGSYQRRRTFGEAIPVGMWENIFLPSRFTPTKMVHLDTDRDMKSVQLRSREDELWPKKIWPTAWPPSVHSNQLELITEAAHAVALLRAECVVVVVVRNEMTMLAHFLRHYRGLGLGCFVFIDNCSDDGTREYLAQQPDVVLYSADTDYKDSYFGVAWQQAVMGNLCLNKWVLLADADELLVYEGCEERPLASLVKEVEAEGADAVRVDMIDMYPFGDLADADFSEKSPFEVAPWFDKPSLKPWRLGSGFYNNHIGTTSHLRHRLATHPVPHDFVSQKFALFRYGPWVRVSQGVHYASNLKVSQRPAWFGHFKYHSGFKDKVMKEIKRGQHFNNAAEYRRYAEMLSEAKGGFGQEGLSQRYENSASFVNADETKS